MSLFYVVQKLYSVMCVEQVLLAVRRKIRRRKSLVNSSKSLLFFSPRLTTRESLSMRYDIREIC